MTENKVYPGWGYRLGSGEKMESNFKLYEELTGKYKIGRNLLDDDYQGYDVVIKSAGKGCGHHKYSIIKNAPALSADELALICDRGNLCFGYHIEAGYFWIHTD